MNKHGQTLIAFIILLPILISLLALVIDIGLITSEKKELEEVSKTIIKEVIYNLEENDKNINELYKKNNIPTDNLKIDINKNSIRLQNEYEIKSIFGNIIGIKKYDIKLDITGILKDNNKIIYE